MQDLSAYLGESEGSTLHLKGKAGSAKIMSNAGSRPFKPTIKTSPPALSRKKSRILKRSLMLNSSRLDSRAKTFHEEARSKALKELEAAYSGRHTEQYGVQNLRIFSLKTQMNSQKSIEGEISSQSSTAFRNWGIVSNGKFLTAQLSEYLNKDAELSLSGILESSPGKECFPSLRWLEGCLNRLTQVTRKYPKRIDVIEAVALVQQSIRHTRSLLSEAEK